MRWAIAGQRGSGSVLTVGIAGGLVALTALSIPLYMALVVRQEIAGAADAAALAAADTASGLVPGYPCETAARVAAANGASLESCTADGQVVTVSAGGGILGLSVVAWATAGPAGQRVD